MDAKYILFILCAAYHFWIAYSENNFCSGDVRNYNVSVHGINNMDCLKLDNSSIPCNTMNYLISLIHSCFNFIIMDDKYFLRERVVFNGVKDVSITGRTGCNKPVKINCEANSGFIFKYSSGIILKNLHINGCSFSTSNIFKGNTDFGLLSYRSSMFFLNTSNIQLIRCMFANHSGLALLIVNAADSIVIDHSNFTGSVAITSPSEPRSGGILILQNVDHYNSSILIHSCYFVGNVYRDNTLERNASLQHGGAITIDASAIHSEMMVFISHCTFLYNKGFYGGAFNILLNGTAPNQITITFTFSKFISNTAWNSGGGVLVYIFNDDISTSSPTSLKIESCLFTNNFANVGGALAVVIYSIQETDYLINISMENSTWQGNSAKFSGYAVELNGMKLAESLISEKSVTIKTSLKDCTFLYNIAETYNSKETGAISATASEMLIVGGMTSFIGNEGTALSLRARSMLKVYGDLIFAHNTGIIGGAILFQDHSQMYIHSSSAVQFDNNSASVMGGAIYSMVTGKSHCVFAFSDDASSKNVNILFYNNSANGLDQSLFVENAEGCKISSSILLNNFNYYPRGGHIFLPFTNVTFTISKSITKKSDIQIMPGEPFFIILKEVRDFFGSVSAYRVNHLWIKLKSNTTFILRVFNITCSDYSDISSTNKGYYVEGPNIHSETNFNIDFIIYGTTTYHVGSTVVSIAVIPCRLGYMYSTEKQICECVSNKSDKIKCPGESQKLCVKYRYWFSNELKSAVPCPAQNCWYMYGKCPVNTEVCENYGEVYCGIKDPDDVCWDGRSGLLCSECAANYSFAFRAFQCAKTSTCSSQNTFFIMLILFAYWSSLALAILAVLSLNLGVGSGFMYGIVYYFSVVTIYTSSNPLFSDLWLRLLVYICIAITQLDPELFGYAVRLCFIRNWTNPLPHQLFHYTTPVFVALLIVTYIIVSRYCKLPKQISLAKMSPIHAICILILFSYTSLCLTNFKILVPIQLFGKLRVRAAPIVPYFGTSHLPFAIIALLVELFIALPVCFLFLSAPCITNHVNLVKYKLKPILDEFQACYRPKCRWFAGFYFMARQLVYLIDGLSTENFPQQNSLLLTLNIIILIVHISFQPYKKKWINILDTILLLDIVVLSTYSVALPNSDIGYDNQIFHSNVVPSLIILIPTVYLCVVVIILVVKKCAISCHCCRRMKTGALNRALTRSFVYVNKEENEYDLYYLADDFHCRNEDSCKD